MSRESHLRWLKAGPGVSAHIKAQVTSQKTRDPPHRTTPTIKARDIASTVVRDKLRFSPENMFGRVPPR